MLIIKLLYVAGGIFFSSLAQIFMKHATAFEGKHLLWALLLLGSMTCYLLSFIAYYQAIKYFPISRVSPVMTVGVVLIIVIYGVFLGEKLSLQHAIGLLLGVFSIFLILS